jgi:hypothetical protein
MEALLELNDNIVYYLVAILFAVGAKGLIIFGYLLAVPQLFSDYLRILKDKCAPGLE